MAPVLGYHFDSRAFSIASISELSMDISPATSL